MEYFNTSMDFIGVQERIYVYFPCTRIDNLKCCITQQSVLDDFYPVEHDSWYSFVNSQSQIFLQTMEYTTKNELKKTTQRDFKRHFLGTFDLKVLTDQLLEDGSYGKRSNEYANLYLTEHEKTGICVVTLVIYESISSITHILDQINRGDMIIHYNHQDILLEDLLKKINVEIVGNARVSTCCDEMPSEEFIPYYFINETYNSSVMRTVLDYNKTKLEDYIDLSKYKDRHLYADYNSVLFYTNRKDVNLEFKSRIRSCTATSEDLSLYKIVLTSDLMANYIIELIVLQDAAISRGNTSVNQYLMDSNYSVHELLKIKKEFGKTMLLWDLDIFVYNTAQKVAESLNKSFCIDKKLEDFLRNLSFLEQIHTLDGQKSTVEVNRLLHFIAMMLFVIEIQPQILTLISGGIHLGATSKLGIALSWIASLIILGIIFSILKSNTANKLLKWSRRRNSC